MTITGFSAAPTCICTSYSGASTGCELLSVGSTSFRYFQFATTTGTADDTRTAHIICMGPK